jgi:thiol-disulfide isomerase/thioredoxin
LRPVIVCLPLIVALGIAGCDKAKPSNEQASDANMSAPKVEAPSANRVDESQKGQAMPAMPFSAPGGGAATLGAFRGKPVLLNLWATWCAPCIKELPSLDALAQQGKVRVVAVSEDMGGDAQVQPFWKAHGLKTLVAYTDAKNRLMSAVGAGELPTTILYDSAGKEVWRASGGFDWTGPEAAALIGKAK